MVGSSVNSGNPLAGPRLKLGRDVVVLSDGALDGTGTATVAIVPPFLGTVLDRYYVQVVFVLIVQVDLENNTPYEVGMTCNMHFSGTGNGGIQYSPARTSVRAARRSTLMMTGTADLLAGTGTITGECGSLPVGVTAFFHFTATQVGTLRR